MLLEARNLTFSYGGAPVLREASVSLRAGEVVGLLGPNGSGKSTLIRVLLGHLHPGGGSVAWDDRALPQWTRRQLARHAAYLAQSPAWESGQTVADVLRLGRTPYLTAFGLESVRDVQVVREVSRSLGLDDLLDRSVDELSGGQRQRAFVGRCLVQEPRALLLDEPNTYLDLRHQVELGRLLLSLARDRGIGVLMASHDLNLARAFSDRLIVLSEGRVVADGPPDEVLRPEVLDKVYGVALERVERPGCRAVVVPRLG